MRIGLMAWLIVMVLPCSGNTIQAPNLGSAKTFGLLSGGTISNTGTTLVNGNVGSVGTDTGFDPNNPYGNVAGGNVTPPHFVYSYADNAFGKPAIDNAMTDFFNAIFNPAASLSNPQAGAFNETPTQTFDELATGGFISGPLSFVADNVNGNNNVYLLKYMTTGDITISAPSIVTFDAQGNSNAIFIVQVSRDLVVNTTNFVLAGNAQVKNIYWTIGRTATLNPTSIIFDGNIFAKTSSTLSNGGTVNGCIFTYDGGGSNTVDMGAGTAPRIDNCNGDVVAPEPASFQLLGLGCILGVIGLRKVRSVCQTG